MCRLVGSDDGSPNALFQQNGALATIGSKHHSSGETARSAFGHPLCPEIPICVSDMLAR